MRLYVDPEFLNFYGITSECVHRWVGRTGTYSRGELSNYVPEYQWPQLGAVRTSQLEAALLGVDVFNT